MNRPSVFMCLLATSSLAIAFVPQQQQWSIGSSGQILARSEELLQPSDQAGVDPNTWDVPAVIAAAAAKAAAEAQPGYQNADPNNLVPVTSGQGGNTAAPAPATQASSNSAQTGQQLTPCTFVLPQYSSGPGNCPSKMVLTEGEECEPQCAGNYAISGIMKCKDGELTAAICQELANGNQQPQVIVVPTGGTIPNQQQQGQQQGTQQQGTNSNQNQGNNQNQITDPIGANETAPAVSFKPAGTSEPVPIGHIIAVLAGALVLIFAPAIYVKSQGGNKKDADADAGDDGNAGAEEGIASETGSQAGPQAGSEGMKVPLVDAAI